MSQNFSHLGLIVSTFTSRVLWLKKNNKQFNYVSYFLFHSKWQWWVNVNFCGCFKISQCSCLFGIYEWADDQWSLSHSFNMMSWIKAMVTEHTVHHTYILFGQWMSLCSKSTAHTIRLHFLDLYSQQTVF